MRIVKTTSLSNSGIFIKECRRLGVLTHPLHRPVCPRSPRDHPPYVTEMAPHIPGIFQRLPVDRIRTLHTSQPLDFALFCTADICARQNKNTNKESTPQGM